MAEGPAGWTSWRKCPSTAGNHQVHAEIHQEQVTHWTPAQIKAAEKQGYFEDLRQRAMKNTRLGLLEEIVGEEE